MSDARGDGTNTLQQSYTLKADTTKMDACNIRAAPKFLQTGARAPQNLQTPAEIRFLVAVEADAQEMPRTKEQCVAVKPAALKFSSSPANLGKRTARGGVLAAEPGPRVRRNADIAAIGRSEGRPAALRDWICIWTQVVVPHQTVRLWTGATIVPLDCGPKKLERGDHVPQPCPRKLSPIALAEVPMKFAESCVTEKHIDKLLEAVETRVLRR